MWLCLRYSFGVSVSHCREWEGSAGSFNLCVCIYSTSPIQVGMGRRKDRGGKVRALKSPLENHILLQCGTWKLFACVSHHSELMWNHQRFKHVDVHRLYLVGFAAGWVTTLWTTCARIRRRNKFLICVGLWRLKQSLLKPYTLFPVTNSRSLPVEYINNYSFGFGWLLSCFVGQIFRRGL